MTVLDITTDPAACSLTLTASFDAGIERVWQIWANPRQLEKWWGPPTYPATFTEHDLRPGGRMAYHMTGPEGERHHGWWEITAVDEPHSIELRDGFADERGVPNAELPVTVMVMTLREASDGTTQMTVHSTFPSTEALEQLVAMGMSDGLRAAAEQIDALLSD